MQWTKEKMITLAAVSAGLAIAPVNATTFYEVETTCPIGGEKFDDYAIGSSTSFGGGRPDGRRYGTLPIYPLPQCPENGFVIFDDNFSQEELAILGEAVASSGYASLRDTETLHYLAWWLAQAAGRDIKTQATLLLRASWETDENEARKQRYQSKFVELASQLHPKDSKDEFWLILRAVNSLRELGRFGEARLMLERVMDPAVWPSDEDHVRAASVLIKGLSDLITDNNPVSEPTNLTPDRVASARCSAEPKLHGAEQEACARLAVKLEKKALAELALEAAAAAAGEAATDVGRDVR